MQERPSLDIRMITENDDLIIVSERDFPYQYPSDSKDPGQERFVSFVDKMIDALKDNKDSRLALNAVTRAGQMEQKESLPVHSAHLGDTHRIHCILSEIDNKIVLFLIQDDPKHDYKFEIIRSRYKNRGIEINSPAHWEMINDAIPPARQAVIDEALQQAHILQQIEEAQRKMEERRQAQIAGHQAWVQDEAKKEADRIAKQLAEEEEKKRQEEEAARKMAEEQEQKRIEDEEQRAKDQEAQRIKDENLKQISRELFALIEKQHPDKHYGSLTQAIDKLKLILDPNDLKIVLDMRNPTSGSENENRTLLHVAIRSSNLKLLEYLIGNKINLTNQDPAGNSAIHQAIIRINTPGTRLPKQLLEQILNAGVNANLPNKQGATALQILLQMVYDNRDTATKIPLRGDVVELLLQHGAKLNPTVTKLATELGVLGKMHEIRDTVAREKSVAKQTEAKVSGVKASLYGKTTELDPSADSNPSPASKKGRGKKR